MLIRTIQWMVRSSTRDYRPQGKVMFSEVSVILFTSGIWCHFLSGCLVPCSFVGVCLLWEWICLLAGVCLLGRCLLETPLVVTSSDGHCSGRYVFYWNTFLFEDTGVTFSLSRYSTPILCRAKQEVEFMYALGVAQYMLNDALCNPGVYINGYSVCVCPLCVLEYERIRIPHKNFVNWLNSSNTSLP